MNLSEAVQLYEKDGPMVLRRNSWTTGRHLIPWGEEFFVAFASEYPLVPTLAPCLTPAEVAANDWELVDRDWLYRSSKTEPYQHERVRGRR